MGDAVFDKLKKICDPVVEVNRPESLFTPPTARLPLGPSQSADGLPQQFHDAMETTMGISVSKKLAQLPKAIVLDDFRNPSLDVTGDGLPDVAHGEIVARLIRDHGVNARTFQTDTDNMCVATHLAQLADMVAHGELGEVSAINLSIAAPFYISELREITGIKELTTQNILEHRDAILSSFRDHGLKHEDYDALVNAVTMLGVVLANSSLEQLRARGVTPFVGAANDGPSVINMAALMPVQVSANDPELGQLSPSSYSGINAASTTIAQGAYAIHRRSIDGAYDRYDFTGDKRPDWIANNGELPLDGIIGKPLVQNLRHVDPQVFVEVSTKRHEVQQVAATLIKSPDRANSFVGEAMFIFLTSKLQTGLYSVQEIANGLGAQIDESKRGFVGDYIYIHKSGGVTGGLVASEDGTIIHLRDKTESGDVIGAIFGTSFATPTALGEAIQRKK